MDTATPVQVQEKDKHADETAEHKKKTRLTRYLLKGHVDENSALIPDDKWAKDAVWDFAKKNKSLHQTAGGMAGFALGSLLTVAAGVVGAIMVTGAAPIAAVALGALAVAGFFAKKAHDFYNRFKEETLPELRKDIGKKYLDLKVGEVKNAWAKKKEEHEKKKAAEKAAKAAAAVTPAPVVVPAVTPDTPKVEVKAEVKPEVKPVEEKKPAATTPPAPQDDKPQTAVGAVGSWLLKKALEQANKKKDTPPPAAQDNKAPEAPKKKEPPPPPKVAA